MGKENQEINTIKLLWVEDDSEGGLVERKALIELSDFIELTIKRNASDAEIAINNESFDKVIFDIRVPPGNGKYWEQLHMSGDSRLGIRLIQRTYETLLKKNTSIGILSIERWDDIREAILSIDSNFDKKKQYMHKDACDYPEDFLDFIQNL